MIDDVESDWVGGAHNRQIKIIIDFTFYGSESEKRLLVIRR